MRRLLSRPPPRRPARDPARRLAAAFRASFRGAHRQVTAAELAGDALGAIALFVLCLELFVIAGVLQ